MNFPSTASTTASMNVGSLFMDAIRFTFTPPRPRDFLKSDIDIVQDLHVVADKPDGRNKHVPVSFIGQIRDHVFDLRSQPRLSRVRGALIGKHPVHVAKACRHRSRVALQFVVVWIAHLQQPFREAMRGKDDFHVFSILARKRLQPCTNVSLLRVQQRGLPPPGIHEGKQNPVSPRFVCAIHGLPVLADTQTGIVRGHHNGNRLFNAIVGHPTHRVIYPWRPVAHANVNAHVLPAGPQRTLGTRRLFKGVVVERGTCRRSVRTGP